MCWYRAMMRPTANEKVNVEIQMKQTANILPVLLCGVTSPYPTVTAVMTWVEKNNSDS